MTTASEIEPVAASAADEEGAESRPAAPKSLDQILVVQFQLLRQQHQAVLETEDANAIHKMRVTTRRIQASLDLLQGHHDKIGVRSLKNTLRSARRMLSFVRNYDVFLELIEKESLTRKRSVREPYSLVAESLRPRRQAKMSKAKRYLASLDVDRIAAKVGLAGESPSLKNGEAAVIPPDAVAEDSEAQQMAPPPRVLDSRWIALHAADRLDQRLAEFHLRASQAFPTTDPRELHQLRIAAKRVRYILEIVSQMGYGDARSSLMWLRSLQDRIGDWHDVEALEDEIVDIVARPRFLKGHFEDGSVLLSAASHLRKRKNQLVSKLFPVRVPKTLSSTCARMSRSLRRAAHQVPGA